MLEFIHAVTHGYEEGVRRGCEAGLVNTYDRYGWTSTMFAIHCKKLHILKILVEYGADLNMTSKNSPTPLMIACWSTNDINQNIVKYLLENGADPSIKNGDGQTAAHYAVMHNNPEGLRLVAVDEVLDIRTNKGNTPMEWAIKHNIPKCVDVLNSAYVWRARRVLIMCIVKTAVTPIRNSDERLLDYRVIRRLGLIMSSYVMGMVVRFIPN